MGSLYGKENNILIESKPLLIKSLVLKEDGKPFKITSNENWKNVLPGDLVLLSFDFVTNEYSNYTKPKMNVTVYRKGEILFKENSYFTTISSMLSHFEIEQNETKQTIYPQIYRPFDNSFCVCLETGESATLVQPTYKIRDRYGQYCSNIEDDLDNETSQFITCSVPYTEHVIKNGHDFGMCTFINVKSLSTGYTYKTLFREDRIAELKEPDRIKDCEINKLK